MLSDDFGLHNKYFHTTQEISFDPIGAFHIHGSEVLINRYHANKTTYGTLHNFYESINECGCGRQVLPDASVFTTCSSIDHK